MELFRPPPNRVARRAQARARRAAQAPKPDRVAPRSRRLAAAAIDGVAGTLVFWTVLVVGAVAGASPFEPRTMFVHVVATVVVVDLYVIAATARRGQTLGKRLVGIRIVRSDTFDLPGWKRATIRTLALVPLTCLPAGAIAVQATKAAALADPRHQGLHDIVAGTVVVDDRSWQPWFTARPRAHRRGHR